MNIIKYKRITFSTDNENKIQDFLDDLIKKGLRIINYNENKIIIDNVEHINIIVLCAKFQKEFTKY